MPCFPPTRTLGSSSKSPSWREMCAGMWKASGDTCPRQDASLKPKSLKFSPLSLLNPKP